MLVEKSADLGHISLAVDDVGRSVVRIGEGDACGALRACGSYAFGHIFGHEVVVFPVNKQDFDCLARRYMTPQYMLDENGEPMLDENGEPIEMSQGGIGWGDGTMLELYATTQEQYDQIMELYRSIDTVYTYDEAIYSIVRSVALRYFNDDLTVNEAVDQIQSRVKIYVNENL